MNKCKICEANIIRYPKSRFKRLIFGLLDDDSEVEASKVGLCKDCKYQIEYDAFEKMIKKQEKKEIIRKRKCNKFIKEVFE